MSNAINYFKNAELSQAAYANLTSGISGGNYIAALVDLDVGMSLTQAQDFAANYIVIDQYSDLSGVSATIFEGRDGKRHLAIRGTEGFGDINADCILAQGFPSYLNPQFLQLRGQIDTWLANGDLTSGFSVTGHSLGGYLAVAVGTWYSGQVGQTYTYNAPGLGGLAGNIFDAFRAVFGFSDAALIPDAVNLRGSAGISVISGLGAQLSPPVLIETEFSLNPFENHSIARLADSLAVYNLFATIDPSLSVGVIGGILQSSTPSSRATQESAVSGLGRLLVQGFVPRIGNHYDSNQNDLYADIKGIASAVSGHSGMSLVPFGTVAANGTYTVFSSTEIQSLAQNDIAYRYALVHLNPFAVLGVDYSRFNTKGELDLVNPTTGQGLSEQYLEDRAKFLALKNELALQDAIRQEQITEPGYFKDCATGAFITNHPTPDHNLRQFLFGSSQGEVLQGMKGADHIFGGGGADTLLGNTNNDSLEGGSSQDSMDGGAGDDTFFVQGTDTDYDVFRGGPGADKILGSKGNDTIRVHRFTGEDTVEVIDGGEGFDVIAGTDGEDIIDLTGTSLISIERIEGGKGNDTILGSMGNDTIHGGEDDDVITGNKGDDLLVGGPGRDVYVYAQGDGHDTIVDSGDNLIQLRLADGSIVPVRDFFAKDASTWESADGRMRLVHNTTWKILMPGGGSIDLGADFEEGDHGIRLINTTPTALTLTGTAYRDEMGFVTYGANPANWDLYFASFPPNEPSTSLFQQQLPSTAPRMHITGGASGDFLFGFQSRDEIYGGDGGDILTGNTRAWRGTALNLAGPLEGDHLDGGAGGDFIKGSGGADQIFGDDGDDFLEGKNNNDLLDGGTGTDVLAGGSGADILFGAEGDDILTGDGYLQLNTSLSLDNLYQFGVTVTPSAEGYHTGFNTAWLMSTGHQLQL